MKSVLNIHWKDWFWSWNSNTWATWCKELTHWKRPWCWERLKAGREGDERRWGGWMTYLTQQRWVWVNSGSWWWTGKPGELQSLGHKVSDVTEWLNWTELISHLWVSHFKLLFLKDVKFRSSTWTNGTVNAMIKPLASWYHLEKSGIYGRQHPGEVLRSDLWIFAFCLLLEVLMHSPSTIPWYLIIFFRPSIPLALVGKIPLATHSRILGWRNPRAEEPGRLQFMGSKRVRHSWATFTHFHLSLLTCCCILCHHHQHAWHVDDTNNCYTEMSSVSFLSNQLLIHLQHTGMERW